MSSSSSTFFSTLHTDELLPETDEFLNSIHVYSPVIPSFAPENSLDFSMSSNLHHCLTREYLRCYYDCFLMRTTPRLTEMYKVDGKDKVDKNTTNLSKVSNCYKMKKNENKKMFKSHKIVLTSIKTM